MNVRTTLSFVPRRPVKVLLGTLIALSTLAAAKTASAACVGRPTDPSGFLGYGYGEAEVKSFAGTKVRVHYATSGPHAPVLTSTRPDSVPDTVAFAMETGDAALTKYEAMGYHAIPSDAACDSNGGDGLVDLYLVHFSAADGSTFAECNGATCSSFALVESTFKSKGYASAEEGFRTVVTHELFHAVQNTYKTGDMPAWAEGTAQWAMKTLHPELQDFERQLPAFFAEPSRSIDAPPGGVTAGFLYGSAVWPLFLSLRHGEDFIRTVFEGEADGTDPMSAIDAALKEKGSSLADEYPLFAAWNAGTGKLASKGGYPDAAKYPGLKTESLKDGAGDISSGFSYFTYKGTLTEKASLRLETDETRNAGVVVPIVDDVLRLDQAKKLPANASGPVLVVVSGVTSKKSDAPFTIHVGAPVDEAPDPGSDGDHDAGAGTSSSGAPEPPAAAPPPEDDGCQAAGAPSSATSGLFFLLFAFLRRRRSSGKT